MTDSGTDTRQLLIVSHSQTGGAAALAAAAAEGARDPAVSGVAVTEADALETGPEAVRAADGLILVTPENFGYMSGALKYFFDHVYYPCLDHTQGLPYALVVKAGNDGTGAATSVARIVQGLRWREVQPPIIVVGDLAPEHLAQARELGMTLAAGLEAGLF